MRKGLWKIVIPAVSGLFLIFSVLHVVRASQSLPETAPPAEPPRTPFGLTVAGSGLVEAESENIAIGSPLPGIVLEVYVPSDRVGQKVRAGDPLFRVDDRHLLATLAYQEAALASAKAQLARLEAQPRPEELPPSEAKVRVAEANRKLQLDQVQRIRQAYSARAVAQEEYTQRQLAYEVAAQQLEQAKAEHALLEAGAWTHDKEVARAAVLMAQAQIAQTRTELDRTLVRAPVAGEVLKVNVRPGEYAGTPPGQALVVLGRVQRLHIRVDINEHDIDRFRPDLPARAYTRGKARREYPLKFVRVEPYVVPKKSLTGDNTERVDTRVLQVIYALDPAPTTPVYVGQQLDVFINARGAAKESRREERPTELRHTD
jgi:HlyD family secretion protein